MNTTLLNSVINTNCVICTGAHVLVLIPFSILETCEDVL